MSRNLADDRAYCAGSLGKGDCSMDSPASGDRGANGAGKCAAFGSVGMSMVSCLVSHPVASHYQVCSTPCLTVASSSGRWSYHLTFATLSTCSDKVTLSRVSAPAVSVLRKQFIHSGIAKTCWSRSTWGVSGKSSFQAPKDSTQRAVSG